MEGNIAQIAKEAEQGNPDRLLILATKANTPLAQQILRDAIEQHGAESAEWHAEWAGTELNAHQW